MGHFQPQPRLPQMLPVAVGMNLGEVGMNLGEVGTNLGEVGMNLGEASHKFPSSARNVSLGWVLFSRAFW